MARIIPADIKKAFKASKEAGFSISNIPQPKRTVLNHCGLIIGPMGLLEMLKEGNSRICALIKATPEDSELLYVKEEVEVPNELTPKENKGPDPAASSLSPAQETDTLNPDSLAN